MPDKSERQDDLEDVRRAADKAGREYGTADEWLKQWGKISQAQRANWYEATRSLRQQYDKTSQYYAENMGTIARNGKSIAIGLFDERDEAWKHQVDEVWNKAFAEGQKAGRQAARDNIHDLLSSRVPEEGHWKSVEASQFNEENELFNARQIGRKLSDAERDLNNYTATRNDKKPLDAKKYQDLEDAVKAAHMDAQQARVKVEQMARDSGKYPGDQLSNFLDRWDLTAHYSKEDQSSFDTRTDYMNSSTAQERAQQSPYTGSLADDHIAPGNPEIAENVLKGYKQELLRLKGDAESAFHAFDSYYEGLESVYGVFKSNHPPNMPIEKVARFKQLQDAYLEADKAYEDEIKNAVSEMKRYGVPDPICNEAVDNFEKGSEIRELREKVANETLDRLATESSAGRADRDTQQLYDETYKNAETAFHNMNGRLLGIEADYHSAITQRQLFYDGVAQRVGGDPANHAQVVEKLEASTAISTKEKTGMLVRLQELETNVEKAGNAFDKECGRIEAELEKTYPTKVVSQILSDFETNENMANFHAAIEEDLLQKMYDDAQAIDTVTKPPPAPAAEPTPATGNVVAFPKKPQRSPEQLHKDQDIARAELMKYYNRAEEADRVLGKAQSLQEAAENENGAWVGQSGLTLDKLKADNARALQATIDLEMEFDTYVNGLQQDPQLYQAVTLDMDPYAPYRLYQHKGMDEGIADAEKLLRTIRPHPIPEGDWKNVAANDGKAVGYWQERRNEVQYQLGRTGGNAHMEAVLREEYQTTLANQRAAESAATTRMEAEWNKLHLPDGLHGRFKDEYDAILNRNKRDAEALKRAQDDVEKIVADIKGGKYAATANDNIPNGEVPKPTAPTTTKLPGATIDTAPAKPPAAANSAAVVEGVASGGFRLANDAELYGGGAVMEAGLDTVGLAAQAQNDGEPREVAGHARNETMRALQATTKQLDADSKALKAAQANAKSHPHDAQAQMKVAAAQHLVDADTVEQGRDRKLLGRWIDIVGDGQHDGQLQTMQAARARVAGAAADAGAAHGAANASLSVAGFGTYDEVKKKLENGTLREDQIPITALPDVRIARAKDLALAQAQLGYATTENDLAKSVYAAREEMASSDVVEQGNLLGEAEAIEQALEAQHLKPNDPRLVNARANVAAMQARVKQAENKAAATGQELAAVDPQFTSVVTRGDQVKQDAKDTIGAVLHGGLAGAPPADDSPEGLARQYARAWAISALRSTISRDWSSREGSAQVRTGVQNDDKTPALSNSDVLKTFLSDPSRTPDQQNAVLLAAFDQEWNALHDEAKPLLSGKQLQTYEATYADARAAFLADISHVRIAAVMGARVAPLLSGLKRVNGGGDAQQFAADTSYDGTKSALLDGLLPENDPDQYTLPDKDISDFRDLVTGRLDRNDRLSDKAREGLEGTAEHHGGEFAKAWKRFRDANKDIFDKMWDIDPGREAEAEQRAWEQFDSAIDAAIPRSDASGRHDFSDRHASYDRDGTPYEHKKNEPKKSTSILQEDPKHPGVFKFYHTDASGQPDMISDPTPRDENGMPLQKDVKPIDGVIASRDDANTIRTAYAPQGQAHSVPNLKGSVKQV